MLFAKIGKKGLTTKFLREKNVFPLFGIIFLRKIYVYLKIMCIFVLRKQIDY